MTADPATAADHRVAVLVLDGAKALDVGIAAHVFAKRPGMPYEVQVCAERAGTVEGWNGLAYAVGHGLEALEDLDPADVTTPPAVIAALLAAHDRGTRIAAISTGAFTLAAAGLLDGRRATTHWHYTHVLRERHPEIEVDENVLFVDAGQVLTSAGAASGIDLCLHLVRRDHGVALANQIARRLVSAPYRSGGQAQYVPRSIPEPLGDVFARTRVWALEHLQEDLTLRRLPAHLLATLRGRRRPHPVAVGAARPDRPRPGAARDHRPHRHPRRRALRPRLGHLAAPPLRGGRRHLAHGVPRGVPGRRGGVSRPTGVARPARRAVRTGAPCPRPRQRRDGAGPAPGPVRR